MSQELKRTYSNYLEWEEKSKQTEYTEKTPLLDADGNLLAKGWARHNVFDYERSFSKPNKRKKEWDFYQISDGRYMVQISFAKISIGGDAAAKIIDLVEKKVIKGIIGLPANLFFGTGIPVCVLMLKRERNGNSDNILFIDASKDFEPGKNQNILREIDIDKIVETYVNRVDVDKYAHVATMAEIEENGYAKFKN